jgi:hypothetical protein
MLALAVASLITALSVGTILADDHHDRGRHRHYSHHSYRRFEPTYPPPPFVYAPAPAPGISLFFPFR